MKNIITLTAIAAFITSASASVTMVYVPVGHAGNAADTTGFGAVGYEYQIGKYEVTNAQYTSFLNAVDPTGVNARITYSIFMGSNARGGITYTNAAASGSKYTIRSSMGDKPVNYVSWYSAARFTNWLHNGQGSGSTETGAYTLSGNTGVITKSVGANVWIPSNDEWYKAAYYDPTKSGTGRYWTYATQSDTVPTEAVANTTGDITNPGANVANYNSGADWNGENGNLTTVGSAAASNYFGTADMNGNVFEYTDSGAQFGGSWAANQFNMRASIQNGTFSSGENSNLGFRVASSSIAAVPEPTAMLSTLALVASGLLTRRRGKSCR